MQEALYHPTLGYYSATIADVGAGGDFATSATLGCELGASIAAWITAKAGVQGWLTIPVIEVGAGNGSLAKTVLSHLGWRKRLLTRYSIVETSPILRKLQQKKLRFQRVHWHASVGEALSQSSGRALIFSNELVDAFPCRLFEKSEDTWREVGVRITPENSLQEVMLPTLEEDPWFGLFGSLQTGQRLERHDSYRKWIESWRPAWKQGAILTIDYGEIDPATRRPLGGTLRAYWKHQPFSGRDLYARFGKQDLTADVNFQDLIRWGEEAGWRTIYLQSQATFAKSHDISGNNICTERLSDPNDAGGSFLVLEQSLKN
jgi:SAM-dependent MidA family methyltransferase